MSLAKTDPNRLILTNLLSTGIFPDKHSVSPRIDVMEHSSTENQRAFELTIFRLGDLWVFDDPSRSVSSEPLVFGMSAIIDASLMLLTGTSYHKMFHLTLSDSPFSDVDEDEVVALSFSHEDEGGGWYWWNRAMLEGWLSPYFKGVFESLFEKSFPSVLYLKIWNVQDSYTIVI